MAKAVSVVTKGAPAAEDAAPPSACCCCCLSPPPCCCCCCCCSCLSPPPPCWFVQIASSSDLRRPAFSSPAKAEKSATALAMPSGDSGWRFAAASAACFWRSGTKLVIVRRATVPLRPISETWKSVYLHQGCSRHTAAATTRWMGSSCHAWACMACMRVLKQHKVDQECVNARKCSADISPVFYQTSEASLAQRDVFSDAYVLLCRHC